MKKYFFTKEELQLKNIADISFTHFICEKEFVKTLSVFSEEFRQSIMSMIDNQQTEKYALLLEEYTKKNYNAVAHDIGKDMLFCSLRILPYICLEREINRFYQTTTEKWKENEEISKIEKSFTDLMICIASEIATKLSLVIDAKEQTSLLSFKKIQPHNTHNNFFSCISIGLLLISLNRMPYGFYTFLKIFLFITSLYYIYKIPQKEKSLFFFCWLACAIVYNPLISLEFDRYEWENINISTILYIMFWMFINTRRENKKKIKEKIVNIIKGIAKILFSTLVIIYIVVTFLEIGLAGWIMYNN